MATSSKILLSVLIPLYNEEDFVAKVLERVIQADLPGGMDREIIVADDCSTDSSVDRVLEMSERYPGMIHLLRTDRNQGKGSAVRRAIAEARGEFSVIQDADLEYNPQEYSKLLVPLLDGRADAVFGSRFLTGGERRVLYFWHSLANKILTTACNMVSDLNLTDMETCYKMFRTSLLKDIPIRSNRFGFEPEITIKLAKRHARIYETSITYSGRTYDEGKKIGLKDAFEAFWLIVKLTFTRDFYLDEGKATLDAFSDAPNFNRWMADTIRPSLGKKVLEIGAGIGNLSRILIRSRSVYAATDRDAESLDRLQGCLGHRPNLITSELDASCLEQYAPFMGKVDTVVCLNVIEHIKDDLGALSNIYQVLEDRGRAIILVPADQNIYGTLDEALGHWRRYSEPQLVEQMRKAGFAVEPIIPFNRISRPGWWLNGKLLKRRVVSRNQLITFDKFLWVWRRIDRFLPWGPTSLIAVGHKRIRTRNNEIESGEFDLTGSFST
jgi:glycosyltransferase involved in cell wall biosynthesis